MRDSRLTISTDTVAAANTTTGINVKDAKGYGLFLRTTVATASVKTFVTGTAEVCTVVAIADTGVCEVQTLTFPTKAAAAAGDYVVVSDSRGLKFAVSIDKTGSDAEPTGAIWLAIPHDYKKKVNISSATTAAQVAVLMEAGLNTLRDFTSYVTTSHAAADGTVTCTSVQLGNITNPVVKNKTDGGAGGITGVQTTGGVASVLQNKYFSIYAPDGNIQNVIWFNVNSQGVQPVVADAAAVYTVVPIAKSATNSAVADAIATAVDALAAFGASNSSHTVTITNASGDNVTNASDTGSTTMVITTTVPGVNETFSLSANTITLSAHGYYTGLKVAATTSDTLPTGLTATNYYAIRVDANTIKLASSAANALAGTAVDITGEGAGTHTLTPAAISGASYKLQASMDDSSYFDLGVSNNVTTTADFVHQIVDPMYNYVRLVWALAAGQVAYTLNAFEKGA